MASFGLILSNNYQTFLPSKSMEFISNRIKIFYVGYLRVYLKFKNDPHIYIKYVIYRSYNKQKKMDPIWWIWPLWGPYLLTCSCFTRFEYSYNISVNVMLKTLHGVCPSVLVYDRNHYFGFGPIPKLKPKLADTFGRYRNRYRNHISKGKSSYQ